MPGLVYQVGLPPRRIDILTEIYYGGYNARAAYRLRFAPVYRFNDNGVSFDEAWATREATDLDGRVEYFIGRNEFLRNKRATGRAKDLADAERLKP